MVEDSTTRVESLRPGRETSGDWDHIRGKILTRIPRKYLHSLALLWIRSGKK